ncbi:MAG: hypothetical protein JSS32_01520 [Verrucomicrobia bacterium]|nr:hypothetical protein [Verrucomicrobiota bacterium]
MIHRFSSFVTLGLILLVLLSLPKQASDNVRSFAVASLTPAWKIADQIKVYLADRPLFWTSSPKSSNEMLQLQLEVLSLKSQLEAQNDWRTWHNHIEEELLNLKQWKKDSNEEFFYRRFEEMNELIQRQYFAVLAPVIYRDPSSWSSSLWIQVGEKDNQILGRTVVGKNSPVVLGSSLVGVVEFVGAKQSRVRLITDSGLILSVRAARGKMQDSEISALARALQDRISPRFDLSMSFEEKDQILSALSHLQSSLGKEDGYYAKGQLQGSSVPFWRARGLLLKGVGFNYDFPDREGPARELRTGRPVGSNGPEIQIIKEGDFLLTSGLDGVFPPGLKAGIVTSVGSLNEGGYSYEIEARPAAANLNDFRTVFVLPPMTSE